MAVATSATVIERERLALFVDALVLSLEAGQGFETAVRAIAAGGGPAAPLASEIAADLALGRGRTRALDRFGAQHDDAARVAAMLALAQRFGTPLAQALAVQAASLRAERRRAAETRARRLPVLILFPLTLCVLPSLLILFLGPPLLSFLR
jgi:tight adherence protein C